MKLHVKRYIAAFLAAGMVCLECPSPAVEAADGEKILAEFDFNEIETFADNTTGFSSENAKAAGKVTITDSYNAQAGKALYLDGSADSFLNVTNPEGGSLLTGSSELTISYEYKPDRTETNWILYAAPNAATPDYKNEKYLGVMEGNGETTVERYYNSGKRPENPTVKTGERWHRVDIVITEAATTVYLNGKEKKAVNSGYLLPQILGENSILQIGKANWGTGEFAKGWIDNLRITNKASSAQEIAQLAKGFVDELSLVAGAVVGTAPDRATALGYRGTDDHTSILTKMDDEKKEIVSYVRKEADLSAVPVTFDLNGDVSVEVDGRKVENGAGIDLSEDRKVIFARDGRSETWTVKKPVLCNNPVLPGQYADPDIDYFDGKFWLYPTTDGFPNWSGTVFHAFSSEDMVNWEDEGIIMQLASTNPGTNDKGIAIGVSPWAVKGSGWAPTIEKKNDKYYFYYCGKGADGRSSIGVAVSDSPAGPYTDKGTELLTVNMCWDLGIEMRQTIDPFIFTEEDGTSYILFGNGGAAIAELNPDMMSIKEGTLKQINGLTDFAESVTVDKANGIYHWTWSCDGADSPNYHLNYGTSERLVEADGTANVTFKKRNFLGKDEEKGILGTAHQSMMHVTDGSGKVRYFMAYHRFYTPTDIFIPSDGLGKHRETCIDEIFFDENGEMTMRPTLEGVGPVVMTPQEPEVPVEKITLNKTELTLDAKGTYTLRATVEPDGASYDKVTWSSDKSSVARVDENGVVTAGAKAGTAVITAEAGGQKAACRITVKVPVEKITLSASKLTLGGGEKYTLKAVITPKNATNKNAVWKSSNPKAASVSQKGVVTAKKVKKAVTAKIIVQADGRKSKACTVTVKPAPGKITLNAKNKTMKKGGSFQIKKKLPKGTASNKVTYKSSNTRIAKVSSSGKVKALKKGTAVITVKTFNGKKAKLKIRVR